MLFLIDYENVRTEGMKGSERLLEEDHVALFYSESAKHMENQYLEQIERTNCKFEVVQLVKAGKNALDFYIASHLGKIYGEGYRGKAVIVSRDSGFEAVRDYWTKCTAGNYQVYLSPTIEMGILKAGGDMERVKELKRMKQTLDIKSFYAGYEERKKQRHALECLFAGTSYETELQKIQKMLEENSTGKVLYLDSLRTFGRNDGLAVYRRLKRLNQPEANG